MVNRKAYVHVYTGDGKGKTTAAFGLALRASGHGMRTYIATTIPNRARNNESVPYTVREIISEA